MSSLTTAGSSMEEEDQFDTRLSLEIVGRAQTTTGKKKAAVAVRLFGEMISPQQDHAEPTTRKKRAAEGDDVAAVASTGGGIIRHGKKARTTTPTQAQQEDGGRWSPSDGGSASRKKLRLTSAQATTLEDSFRAHNILSHAQKHELARRVGLSARQVEVWFQNRRARTKLKQTEVDCELLRRWCDRLTDENARLRRDLAELRRAAGGGVCASCGDNKIVMASMVAGGGNVA